MKEDFRGQQWWDLKNICIAKLNFARCPLPTQNHSRSPMLFYLFHTQTQNTYINPLPSITYGKQPQLGPSFFFRCEMLFFSTYLIF